MYTCFEDELAIFEPAARFCSAPGGSQGAHIVQKQINSDRACACGRNKENAGDACIRGLRASGPFLGPLPAFAPRRAAPRVHIEQKQNNSDRARAYGIKWRQFRRCVYTYFEGERAIFGPAARFCPAPGGTEGAYRAKTK
jgi:hypothetical protein